MSEGECDIKYKGKIYKSKKGNVVLYPPNTEQLYTLYRDSKTIWVHFNGYYVENVLSEAKICGGVHLIPHSIMIEKNAFPASY